MTSEPRPTGLPSNTERAYRLLAPLARRDRDSGWPLLKLLAALTAAEHPLWQAAEDPGLGALTPQDAPEAWLPLLERVVGARTTPAMSLAERRAEIADPSGWRRGTLAYLRARIQAHLTGTRLVSVVERDESPWHITIRTRADETPDPDAVERAITDPVRGLPAGITHTYSVSDLPLINEGTALIDDVDPEVTIDEATLEDITATEDDDEEDA